MIFVCLIVAYLIWAPIEGPLGNSSNSISFSLANKTILDTYTNRNISNPILFEEHNSTIKDSKGTTTYFTQKYLINNQTKTVSTTNSFDTSLDREIKLLQISILFGILGSSIHGLTSLSTWNSTNKLKKSYFQWFLTKSFIGGALALIIYALLRASLLSGVSSQSGMMNPQGFVNVYGVAGLSALVGLMTEPMTRKLRDVFDTIFGIDKGSDKDDVINTDDGPITLIPSELYLKKNEEVVVRIAVKNNDDKPVKGQKIIFSISDTEKLTTSEKGSIDTDDNGMISFKVKSINEGNVAIIVYCEMGDQKYMETIKVHIDGVISGSEKDGTTTTTTTKPQESGQKVDDKTTKPQEEHNEL
ncbi:MAG: hypothetical protein ABJB76_01705 [Candidatus Nitrosocosmicus sp.]